MHTCGRCRIPATRREYWVAKLRRNARRDRRNRRALVNADWQVLTIWECQTQTKRLPQLRNKIATFLAS
jgi:DNA mismatch endonuclease (patch repair protein)